MAKPPDLLSEVDFGAFLVYSPRGSSDESRYSRDVVYAVKQDKHEIIAKSAKYLRDHLTNHEIAKLLGRDSTLVPTPRSAPFPRDARHALWPAKRICDELVKQGFGAAVTACLERHTSVRKSAFAPRGTRPSPEEHVASMAVTPLATNIERIVIVDDVVTKGATLLAAASWIRSAYPRVELACFALVRTRGFDEVDRIDDPCVGRIWWADGDVHRAP